MSLLANLVRTSLRVAATSARRTKVRELGQFLQALPRVALRLARVKRYRDDKRAEDADTMESVRRIYAAQAGTS